MGQSLVEITPVSNFLKSEIFPMGSNPVALINEKPRTPIQYSESSPILVGATRAFLRGVNLAPSRSSIHELPLQLSKYKKKLGTT